MGKSPNTVAIGRHRLGGEKPLFILGPCVIESELFLREIGPAIRAIADAVGAAHGTVVDLRVPTETE